MLRQNFDRIDPKRKNTISHKKKQFADAAFKQQEYPFRLNFYEIPPTAEITLEEFEQWAIDRLKVLAELESCTFRNRSPAETVSYMTPLLQKYLPLGANTSASSNKVNEKLREERQKDHYSHFILRLAFSSTEDLRRRFSRIETSLFRMRFLNDDTRERQAFVESLDFDWKPVPDEERRELLKHLLNATPTVKRQELEEGGWFKVDWERVPELVEQRKVFVRHGMAYVPAREQLSMVLQEFTSRLDKALEMTARALPRLDEDDRLSPILNHLSKNFAAPDASFAESNSSVPGAAINAGSVDALSKHFPLCMRSLHNNLRKNSHLKHYGRLQYTLFLKGIGLSMDECLVFWRHSFKLITDDTFNKEYRYNIRHAYGDVGGDSNRRGRGYTPFSCQKILMEHTPGAGENHGCPYRHFSVDNLVTLLQSTGVSDREVISGVKDDVGKQRYHIACNRVFDHIHKQEIEKAKAEGMGMVAIETITHPNTYFRRSYLLKSGIKVEDQGDAMET